MKIFAVEIILSGLLTSAGVFIRDRVDLHSSVDPSGNPASTQMPQQICSEQKGSIQLFNYYSPILNKPYYLRVYTPPCYDAASKMQYPVLYMLHGQSFNNDQWDRLGMDEAADRLISSGEIAPFIIVFPQECAYLEDTHTSNYGDAVLTELLPWVESHFPVQADPAHRAIGGLSRGAGWALRLGLSHPEQFGSIGMHSLAQFPGDFYQIPIWRKKPQKKTSPASIWI